MPLRSEHRENGSDGLKYEKPMHAGRTQHSCWHKASLETSREAKTSPTTSLAGNIRIEQLPAGSTGLRVSGKVNETPSDTVPSPHLVPELPETSYTRVVLTKLLPAPPPPDPHPPPKYPEPPPPPVESGIVDTPLLYGHVLYDPVEEIRSGPAPEQEEGAPDPPVKADAPPPPVLKQEGVPEVQTYPAPEEPVHDASPLAPIGE